MRAPDQALDDDAALGGAAEQLPMVGPSVAHPLIGIATPIGEEQIVALAKRLDLGDQPVEVRRTVNQRLSAVPAHQAGIVGGRVASFLRGEEPVCEFRHATRNSRR